MHEGREGHHDTMHFHCEIHGYQSRRRDVQSISFLLLYNTAILVRSGFIYDMTIWLYTKYCTEGKTRILYFYLVHGINKMFKQKKNERTSPNESDTQK